MVKGLHGARILPWMEDGKGRPEQGPPEIPPHPASACLGVTGKAQLEQSGVWEPYPREGPAAASRRRAMLNCLEHKMEINTYG